MFSLQYYDPPIPVSVEVDASQKGLGAVFIQQGKPVAYSSKTLTECQSRYSKIDREMLAIVHGVQQFHTYLYGHEFKIITDHKPLVTICSKPLHAALPCLQRMVLMIQGYDYNIQHRSGKELLLADALSRLPNPKNKAAIELDIRVDEFTTAIINFSAKQQKTV